FCWRFPQTKYWSTQSMKKNLISASAAACLALGGLALPAAAEVPITLKAGIGYWFFDHEVYDFEPDDASTPFVGMEWAFDDNWAVEVLYADDDTEFKHGGPDVD